MDCSQLVDGLLQNGALVSLFPTDATGHPAIYQILSPQAELVPRVAVFETTRAYTAWADDAPIRERSEYRLDLYASVTNLFNRVTFNTFVGNLRSPFFGEAKHRAL